MPKKIDTTKEMILDVARQIISEGKYEDLNCREIAKRCNIAVGTLYHFFASKMEILALIILSDWKNEIGSVQCEVPLNEGIRNIYQAVYDFSFKYAALWKYTKSNSNDYVSYLDRHELLIKQIGVLLNKVITFNNIEIDNDVTEFISENILSYATNLKDFTKTEKIFIKIIGG